jgi:hypothetical protein
MVWMIAPYASPSKKSSTKEKAAHQKKALDRNRPRAHDVDMAQLGTPSHVIKRADLKPKPEMTDEELLKDALRLYRQHQTLQAKKARPTRKR